MASYLSSDNIIEEFTYVGESGNSIEHHNHSINILSFSKLSDEQENMLLSDCVFNDKNMFKTAMYTMFKSRLSFIKQSVLKRIK